MTKLTYYEAPPPVWADFALTVASGQMPLMTLGVKVVNFTTRRHYLGLKLHNKIGPAALRRLRRLFAAQTAGLELEALVATDDERAQRFCEFFGLARLPNYEVDNHFVYEKVS